MSGETVVLVTDQRLPTGEEDPVDLYYSLSL